MIGQLVDHLFQSTLFALAAALLVLAFRKNRARIRHSLWLAASIKFLIPFSMLIALGSQIHWTPAAHEIATRAASQDIGQTVEQFSEPFTAAIPAQPRQTDRRPFAIAALIAAMWFCGFAFIIVLRLRAWRGMRIAIHRSQRLDLGLLVEVRLSSGVFEPGIVGLWRPMLLLPQGILERLTRSELDAVIAHELCHIRRRDNLFAAIHMLIEALFWFHPLVWWIGARLLDERERACDEHVISLGNQPDIYADAILNVCKLYTESPLACVSGVTGADIRRRLEAIMSNSRAAGLNRTKKIILACAAVAAVAVPLSIGVLIAQSQPAPVGPIPKFDVASIRPCVIGDGGGGGRGTDRAGAGPQTPRPPAGTPGRLILNCVDVQRLISTAYLHDRRGPDALVSITGGPAWIKAGLGPNFSSSDRYTIQAEAEGNPSDQVMRGPMRQSLLEDRFKLRVHRETKDVPGYALTVARGKAKLQPFDGKCLYRDPAKSPSELPDPGQAVCENGVGAKGPNIVVALQATTMNSFTGILRMLTSRPVADKTGIAGLFDIEFEYGPDENYQSHATDFCAIRPNLPVCKTDSGTASDPAGPSIFTVLEEQFGLKLEPTTGSKEFLIIDHIERPSEN